MLFHGTQGPPPPSTSTESVLERGSGYGVNRHKWSVHLAPRCGGPGRTGGATGPSRPRARGTASTRAARTRRTRSRCPCVRRSTTPARRSRPAGAPPPRGSRQVTFGSTLASGSDACVASWGLDDIRGKEHHQCAENESFFLRVPAHSLLMSRSSSSEVELGELHGAPSGL